MALPVSVFVIFRRCVVVYPPQRRYLVSPAGTLGGYFRFRYFEVKYFIGIAEHGNQAPLRLGEPDALEFQHISKQIDVYLAGTLEDFQFPSLYADHNCFLQSGIVHFISILLGLSPFITFIIPYISGFPKTNMNSVPSSGACRRQTGIWFLLQLLTLFTTGKHCAIQISYNLPLAFQNG